MGYDMRILSKLTGNMLAASLLTVVASFSVNASDLSPRFIDADGDMVADAPTDPSEWVDPKTLVFAYTPAEDPALYVDVWEGFLKHMEAVTGKRVRYFPVQSYAAQVEAMRAGRLHIAGINTGSVPLAVNCAGFVPFAMMAYKDGSFGYEMEIITHPDSGISAIEDIRGRSLAFTAPTSNSGYKAPSALLNAEFNMVADVDYKPYFSGAHDNSILGVINRDYDAAAIANSVLKRMIARGIVRPESYKTIYTSGTFPTTAYGYIYNLKPELAEKIKEAFFTFDWEGSKLLEAFGETSGEQFIPITYKEHWEVIRTVDKAMGVKYNCD